MAIILAVMHSAATLLSAIFIYYENDSMRKYNKPCTEISSFKHFAMYHPPSHHVSYRQN